MIPSRYLTRLAAVVATLATAVPLAAQDVTADSATAVQDTAPKKKGLFGKVKAVAGNKVVKAVAKTAACTMVPGGQVIAGAIDAAGSESAGEAASGAAAAAAGTSCMPGMGAATLAGAAGAGMGGAGLPGAGMAGGLPMPTGGMPMGYAPGMPSAGMGYGAPESIDATAACLGMSPSEYQDLMDPTRGEARAPTKDEAKRQQRAAQKMNVRKYQECMMAGVSAGREGGR